MCLRILQRSCNNYTIFHPQIYMIFVTVTHIYLIIEQQSYEGVIIIVLRWNPTVILINNYSLQAVHNIQNLFQWLPESPRFDLVSGRPVKARESLEWASKLNNVKMPEGNLYAEPEVNFHLISSHTLRYYMLRRNDTSCVRFLSSVDKHYSDIGLKNQ